MKDFMTWVYPTKEIDEKVYNKLDAFNKPRKDTLIEGCYFISVGERKHNYFTLWRWINPNNPKLGGCFRGKPSHYIKNLSTDFETAVDKALEYVKASRSGLTLDVDRDTNAVYSYDSQVFCFGKYKGEPIEQVAEKDMNYLIWMDKNLSPSQFKSKTAQANLEAVKAQVDFYFDCIAAKNRETSKSDFVGKAGDKLTNLSLVIKSIRLKVIDNSDYDGTYYRFIDIVAFDGDENRYSISVNEGTKNFATEMVDGKPQPIWKVGDTLRIERARIKSTFESLGRKTTALNYIKFA